MCGRGAFSLSAEQCRRVAGGSSTTRATGKRRTTRLRGTERLKSKYNLGPQSNVAVVRPLPVTEGSGLTACDSDREVCAMRWGLVPSFAKRAEDYDVFKGGSSTFNARVEGAESSGLWKRLVENHRSIVLFDGFYEWKASGKSKQPMFIRNRDEYSGYTIPWSSEGVEMPEEKEGKLPMSETSASTRNAPPLLLAGLFDVWRPPPGGQAENSYLTPGEALESVSILTMDSMGTQIEKVHDRMPVFLTPRTAALWLDPTKRFNDIIREVLQASKDHSDKDLVVYEVGPLVSNIRNESPECVMPKSEYDKKQLAKGLGRFFKKKVENESKEETAKRKAEDGSAEDQSAKVIKID